MKALRKVGYIFIGLELVLSIIFMILLVMTSMVPLALTIIVGVILFALPVLFIFMLKKKKSGISWSIHRNKKEVASDETKTALITSETITEEVAVEDVSSKKNKRNEKK